MPSSRKQEILYETLPTYCCKCYMKLVEKIKLRRWGKLEHGRKGKNLTGEVVEPITVLETNPSVAMDAPSSIHASGISLKEGASALVLESSLV